MSIGALADSLRLFDLLFANQGSHLDHWVVLHEFLRSRILVLDLIFLSVIVLQSLIITWCRFVLYDICLNLAKFRCWMHTVELILSMLVNHLTLVHPERLVQKLAKHSIARNFFNLLDTSIVILLDCIPLLWFDFGQIVFLHLTCSKDRIFLSRWEDALALDSVQHRLGPAVDRVVLLCVALWRVLFLSIAYHFNCFVPRRALKFGHLSGFLRFLLQLDRWLSVFDSKIHRRRDVKRVELSLVFFDGSV